MASTHVKTWLKLKETGEVACDISLLKLLQRLQLQQGTACGLCNCKPLDFKKSSTVNPKMASIQFNKNCSPGAYTKKDF